MWLYVLRKPEYDTTHANGERVCVLRTRAERIRFTGYANGSNEREPPQTVAWRAYGWSKNVSFRHLLVCSAPKAFLLSAISNRKAFVVWRNIRNQQDKIACRNAQRQSSGTRTVVDTASYCILVWVSPVFLYCTYC